MKRDDASDVYRRRRDVLFLFFSRRSGRENERPTPCATFVMVAKSGQFAGMHTKLCDGVRPALLTVEFEG